MVVLRSNTKGNIHNHDGSGSSSSNSKRLRSTDVSDPSLDHSKRLRSRVVPARNDTFTSKEVQDAVRPYAADAMNVYNKRAGTKYELLEPGYLTSVLLRTCFLHHVDFTAKKTDVADAPVEMFFAELTTTSGVRCVKVCRCMGPRESILGDKNNGCCYCESYNVQHPRDGGFSRGGEGLFLDC
ncbi:hypothetical protein MKW92_001161 [Papaver armeniacum]|nr:hypothetical protein MKW92_001161 [Papaver armeniacum]